MSTAEGCPRHRRTRATAASRTIKEEPTEDDIKDFAETTMNELLGWYGYDKVDSRDTQGLNLQHFTGATSPSSTADGSERSEEGARTPGEGPISCNGTSSRSGSPQPEDTAGLPPGCIICAWCQKVGMKLFTLKSANGSKAFCSELCFTQCRRASFKKNKICDWCKHVRHTVNYVDFQDGEQQLQFCSDKCLNQYKMNIFCKETQAHLQMHPHLQDAANKGQPGGALITPDLWLRDCKTNGHEASDEREGTPENLTVTPSPTNTTQRTPEKEVPVCLTKHSGRHRMRRIGRSLGRKEATESLMHPRHTVRSPNSNCSTPQSTSSNNSHQNPVVNGPTSGPRLRTSPHPQPPHSMPSLPFHMGGHFGPGEPLRPPFPPPGMLPGPLNLLAQQHIENLIRLQHGIRPPVPPNLFPPFPNFQPNSHPHTPFHPHPPSQPPGGVPMVPPVTTLVPYPILLPLPVPIPIVVPVPLNFLKKNRQNQKDVKLSKHFSATSDRSNSSRECPVPSTANFTVGRRDLTANRSACRSDVISNPSRPYHEDETGDESSNPLLGDDLTSDDDSLSDTPNEDDLSDSSSVPPTRSFESFPPIKIKSESVSDVVHRPRTIGHHPEKRTAEKGLDFSQGKKKCLGGGRLDL